MADYEGASARSVTDMAFGGVPYGVRILQRDYQDDKWSKEFNDADWSISDWLVFIERYLQEAKDRTGRPYTQMASVRKIAALAVACMEYHRAPGAIVR